MNLRFLQISQTISSNRQIGIAAAVVAELKRIQRAPSPRGEGRGEGGSNTQPHCFKPTLIPLLHLLLVLSTGCSLKQPHAEKHTFALEATRTAAARALSLPVQLQVRLATVTPPFDNQTFTYRTSDLGYKSDFYNGFVSPPNILLSAQLQSWLGASKLFHSVQPATSTLPATHTLETQVLTLHGDFRNPSAPKAILEARFQLLDQRRATPSLVFDKSYREEIPFADPQPDALARAWSQALGKVFTALETDLGATAIH